MAPLFSTAEDALQMKGWFMGRKGGSRGRGEDMGAIRRREGGSSEVWGDTE